jgi:hypothetical protein
VPARRVALITAILALVTGGLIWNLVFDMWLGQVERQYLFENARHELQLGPPVSLKSMMADGSSQAFWVATAWTFLVILSIAAAAYFGYRQGRSIPRG